MSASPGLHRVFLYPLAMLLSVFTGEPYAERDGLFFFSDFILDYSCAGINFFAIAAITTALMLPVGNTDRKQLRSLPLQICLLLSAVFAVTLAANFLRIALYLRLQPLAQGRAWLHEAVGITVFLSILISFSLILYRIKNAKQPANP